MAGVARTVVLGSSCIYPRDAPQPIPESALLQGPLEPTNEGYAIAKISVLELARMYRRQYGMDVIALMPTNLYGPGDNYHPTESHVLAALLRRAHEAKQSHSPTLTVWGSGTPRREFLHSDDLADAAVFAARVYKEEEHLNVGTGLDLTIRELAQLIADTVGWRGELIFDSDRPDGTPRKLLDVSKLAKHGWVAKIELPAGLRSTYRSFLETHGSTR